MRHSAEWTGATARYWRATLLRKRMTLTHRAGVLRRRRP
jgi:hypothetical protein